MSNNLLSVPISRFEPDRELSCDIYLRLPLNRKTLKIVSEGQDISSELLEKLKAKGHTELSVSWDESKGSDPAVYPLYKVDAPNITTPEEKFAPTPQVEVTTKITAAREEADLTQQNFAADKPEKEVTQRFSSEKAPKDEPSFNFSAQKPSTDKTEMRFSAGQPDKNSDETIIRSTAKAEEESIRISATSAKISERIRVLATKSDGQNNPEEMTALLSALEATEAGEELPAELAASLATDQDPAANDEENERAAAASRDLPATASRLAAYLGIALGYCKIDFLADLGTGAVAHFAKKQGTGFEEASLPEFVKAVNNADSPPNAQKDDYKKIVDFLDVYLSDPECDRSLRDIDKRLFYKTLSSFEKDSDQIDPWSLKKWTISVEAGPTLESHSLCSKASARALKTIKLNGAEN